MSYEVSVQLDDKKAAEGVTKGIVQNARQFQNIEQKDSIINCMSSMATRIRL